MTETCLGKINKVYFGFGGYQDCQIGISFSLASKSSGVHDFWGTWSVVLVGKDKPQDWHEARRKVLVELVERIEQTLKEAKKNCVSDLQGVPVEIVYVDRVLASWRVLTEVL